MSLKLPSPEDFVNDLALLLESYEIDKGLAMPASVLARLLSRNLHTIGHMVGELRDLKDET